MGYILISADVVRSKGLQYFETMPDGRAILDVGMIRVLGNVSEVEIVASAKTLKDMIAAQKNSGQFSQQDMEVVDEQVAETDEEAVDETAEEIVEEATEATENETTEELTNEEEVLTDE